MENKLEGAARKYADISEDVAEPMSLSFQSDLGKVFKYHDYQAFKKGAEWQKNNMWISVKEGLPEVENSVFVLTKNGKISVSKMYIPKDCHGNILGEKEWHGSASFRDSIIAWMPIPKSKKGE